MNYTEITGDLIELALQGKFDVIAHGCNCFCSMKSGIAPLMANKFGCDTFPLEHHSLKGCINKLGSIDYMHYQLKMIGSIREDYKGIVTHDLGLPLIVVNAYTQFNYGKNHTDGVSKPLDYEALTLCLRKMNKIFKGKHIGLPKIGCGLAGGDWNIVKEIIKKELIDCNVTIVLYN